jgi:uncharacterized membrane protein YkvA (DUF1232 family)
LKLSRQCHNKNYTPKVGQRWPTDDISGVLTEAKEMALVAKVKSKAAKLKREITALYLVYHDPRTPWYAKVFIAGVVAYALSPIDLIPDPVPVLGYLDDLILLPMGVYFALKLIPGQVLADCRAKASASDIRLPQSRWAAAIIALLWIATVILGGGFLMRIITPSRRSTLAPFLYTAVSNQITVGVYVLALAVRAPSTCPIN